MEVGDLGYQDSSEDENDMTVVMDDTAGPSGEMETVDEDNVDENCNENDSETSDEESEADLIMPVRKTKDPSPVWTCADRVEGGWCFPHPGRIWILRGLEISLFVRTTGCPGLREQTKDLSCVLSVPSLQALKLVTKYPVQNKTDI